MFNYYTIEIEATNYCNAKCIFCANNKISRPRGFISLSLLASFFQKQAEIVKNNFFKQNTSSYPKISFCGLGDPLLHPQIDLLIKSASENGFFTHLVTNGELLTPSLANKLVAAGLNELAISLHSINPINYFNITGIDLSKTMHSINSTIDIFHQNGINVSFWRIYHPKEEYRDSLLDNELYINYAKSIGIETSQILGPSEPWERDGIVPDSKCSKTDDFPFWCNKIYFTFNIDWQGNVVLCCNDYSRESVRLGNVFEENYDFCELFRKKLLFLSKKEMPQICLSCRRWSDNELEAILQNNHLDYSLLNSIIKADIINNEVKK